MAARRLILATTSLPLAAAFRTAAGAVGERRTVLVGIDDGTAVGWGEAGPFPGVTHDTVEIASVGLARSAAEILGGGHPASLSPTARAAVDEARTDLAARRAGRPLWRHLGGTGSGVMACAAVGMAHDIETLLEAVAGLDAAGYRSVKLKIEPGHDLAPLSAVRSEFPEMIVGVDANGSYDDPDDPGLRRVAEMAAYVEQPFAAGDLDSHRRLRGPGVTVVLDESIGSPADAAAAISSEAADVVTVKPGRIGVDGCLRILAHAASREVGVKASSLLESGVGRAYTLAVATLPQVAMADIAGSDRYFAADPWAGAIQVRDGMASAPEAPGIGIEIDPESLAIVDVFEA